ncbi:Spy/CpxP family protein refolding chaperone [Halomonas sp. TRM85114]|uniref:Spy/CpxP family protein refolding chaperone n=1 Tax=Halomonas jincaotanensis TaxID=2810616 RepID=UPI001BD51962|nr:Spy/CpxP family protein refolding chaperone [Halomonas jincaotanensis]MBS9405333.1 Spy/CpxP family protein refolding chaperone [Halomonas jincaotanensis]
MEIRKHTLALGLALAVGVSGIGVALAQGMPDTQPGQGNGMMGGNSGQGGAGPDMTGGMMGGSQGGMGSGMMSGMMGGGQDTLGPGMMGGGMMPCPMMGGNGMGMMQGMLEPEQRTEMRELMQEHRPAQFERMGRLMNLRDDLMAEMQGERPNPEEVKTLHGHLAELHGEMMAERVRMRNAMHDLMTDEQRQQLQQATPESDVDPEDHEAHH